MGSSDMGFFPAMKCPYPITVDTSHAMLTLF